MMLLSTIIKNKRQWLFCRRRQFTLRDYFAVSCLWLVNLNDVLNMWLLVVSDWSILKTKKKILHPPRSLSPTLHTPLQCTLPCTFTYRACPSSVHCLSFKALASWDSNPIPWYLKTSALSTAPQNHWCDNSKYGYINTREWSRQNRFQGQIAVDGKIATAKIKSSWNWFSTIQIACKCVLWKLFSCRMHNNS